MSTQPANPFNIVLLGNAGTGKSSVVNLLLNENRALVGNNAKAVTLASTPYDLTIRDIPFRIHDTVGLGDEPDADVPDREAIVGLYKLLKGLQEGISLLIYCIKATRFKTQCIRRNWKFFHEIICKREVPIILLITGAEESEEEDELSAKEDQWWLTPTNAEAFREHRLYPNAVACITASKGKRKEGRHVYQAEYDQSRARVQALIMRHYASPWRLKHHMWLTTIYHDLLEAGCFSAQETKRIVKSKETIQLITDCGMDEQEALQLANALDAADSGDRIKARDHDGGEEAIPSRILVQADHIPPLPSPDEKGSFRSQVERAPSVLSAEQERKKPKITQLFSKVFRRS